MQIFFKLDKNRDGYITLKELREGVKDFENMEELSEILKGVDVDNNGAINYTEFIAATLDQTKYLSESKRIRDAFNVFDKDGDGIIDEEEMKEALNCEDGDVFREIIKECDLDGDGKVDFKEFQEAMKS